MSDVFLSSPYNSQMFTTCCKVAICDYQQKCPICKDDVYPFYKGMSDEEREEASGGYKHHTTHMRRWSRAYKGRTPK